MNENVSAKDNVSVRANVDSVWMRVLRWHAFAARVGFIARVSITVSVGVRDGLAFRGSGFEIRVRGVR